MIEVLNMPAVANDIRLSTLEPIQQLGARLAPILGAELSRLRADSAFTQSVGVPLQAAAADAERMRAEQLSSINSRLVSLDTQALDGSRSSKEWLDARQRRDDENSGGAESNTDEQEQIEQHQALKQALVQALRAVQVAMSEEGFSGEPIACVLPLAGILSVLDDSPSWYERDSGGESDDRSSLLVLCLAFDGSLGESRRIWGFAYRQDQLLGQLEGFWSHQRVDLQAHEQGSEGVWQMKVSDVHHDVSSLQCERKQNQCLGFRLRQGAGSDELDHWTWQARSWQWF